MDIVREEIIKLNGYNVHLVQNEKFKTINMVVKLKAPLSRETITNRALLPYILQQGTQTYPNKRAFQRKLDDLYGAVLSIDGAKKGNNHILSFRMEFANQKYIANESSIFNEAMNVLHDVIFKPNIQNDAFVSTVFNREKETLKQKISSIVDNKINYANMRLIDAMCKGETYQIHVHGYEEDLEGLTAENAYQYYQEILAEDEMDIYILGDFDREAMLQSFSTVFTKRSSIDKERKPSIVEEQKKISRPNEIIERQSIQQAKLHIGYRTNVTYRDEEYGALQVFNGLFGGFPSSKLFINVREKNSLAYYASSRLESHKGLLLIFSGIAPNDYKKARNIIELQMEAMKNGDFSEEELEETKVQIVNQLLETMDNPQGIVEMLYQQVISNRDYSPEVFIKDIKQVNKAQVVQIGQHMTEDTVYLLTDNGGDM